MAENATGGDDGGAVANGGGAADEEEDWWLQCYVFSNSLSYSHIMFYYYDYMNICTLVSNPFSFTVL